MLSDLIPPHLRMGTWLFSVSGVSGLDALALKDPGLWANRRCLIRPLSSEKTLQETGGCASRVHGTSDRLSVVESLLQRLNESMQAVSSGIAMVVSWPAASAWSEVALPYLLAPALYGCEVVQRMKEPDSWHCTSIFSKTVIVFMMRLFIQATNVCAFTTRKTVVRLK